MSLPRIVFVLGKGGSGRSTVSAALGRLFAGRGERTLIVQWALTDPISPWFHRPPADHRDAPLAERLFTMRYSLDETLREYFVDHLGLTLFHDAVVKNRYVRSLVRAAPGLAELLFCGRLFWLTALAREETGAEWDRIVVDAPAIGHGRTLFELPGALAAIDPAGLLALEARRVSGMLADPAWTGALLVTLPEELGIEETLEQLARLHDDLRRGPIGFAVNRSAARLGPSGVEEPALRELYAELAARNRREAALRDRVQGAAPLGVIALDEALLCLDDPEPLAVVDLLAASLARHLP